MPRVKIRMPVHRPTARLALQRFRRTRGLPSLARNEARRPQSASLALTSMIDALVVLAIFLLMTFSPDANARDRVEEPSAVNVSELVDAPMVSVVDAEIWLNGEYIGATDDTEGTGQVVVLTELRNRLFGIRAHAKLARPNAAPPSTIILDIDRRAPAVVVKSLYKTAASAGYVNISLMVEHR
jgi:biopolymer transport protein ExbD